jgi:hypothetical protein
MDTSNVDSNPEVADSDNNNPSNNTSKMGDSKEATISSGQENNASVPGLVANFEYLCTTLELDKRELATALLSFCGSREYLLPQFQLLYSVTKQQQQATPSASEEALSVTISPLQTELLISYAMHIQSVVEVVPHSSVIPVVSSLVTSPSACLRSSLSDNSPDISHTQARQLLRLAL